MTMLFFFTLEDILLFLGESFGKVMKIGFSESAGTLLSVFIDL